VRHTASSGLVGVLFALAAAGCHGEDSTRPTLAPSPQTAPVPQPAPPPVIRGQVADSAFRPLRGARVAAVDGPSAGTSTTTDTNGLFSLAGTFDSSTRFSAEMEGYITATGTWTQCATCAIPWLGFTLALPTPPVAVAGEYTVTFIADNACTDVPAEWRSRTYPATMAPYPQSSGRPVDTAFELTLNEGTFLGGLDTIYVGVAGDAIAMWFGGEGPYVVEEVAPNTYLGFDGAIEVVATAPVRSITASFTGWVDYCALSAPMGQYYNCPAERALARSECQSSNHQLIVTRR
jgi:hypothetical protein